VFLQLECDGSMVEELRGSLEPAAGCASAWHSVGDDDSGVDGLFRSSRPCMWLRMVVYCVGCVCYASARYVLMLFLLI
jgi:hypothetical protein